MTIAYKPNDAFGDADEAFGEIGDPSPADFDALTRVRDAIVAGRIDLYVQPIVRLPDRTPRFHEAFSRLRDAEGGVLTPASYLEAAERAHRIGVIDNLILTRCIDAIMRRGAADDALTVFCNLSPATLFDSEFFDQFTSYLQSHEGLENWLVFEFTLPSIHMMHPRVVRNLEAIAEKGFRFSVDHVHTTNLDWAGLRQRNFRFVKASARTLSGTRNDVPAEERIAKVREFNAQLADRQIALIAEKIERESDLAIVEAAGVAYAQGHLFGSPRPADFYLAAVPADPA